MCQKVIESTDYPHPVRYRWVWTGFRRYVNARCIVTVVVKGQQDKVGHREQETHKCEDIRRYPPWTYLEN